MIPPAQPAQPAQPTTQTTATTATSTPNAGTDEIVASLPIPLVRLLILFSRPLKYTRSALEVLQWRGETAVSSWCVVGAWWAVCLGGGAAWRYFLPLLLLIPFVPLPSTPSLTPAPTTLNPPLVLSRQPYTTPSNPATSQTLLLALADLHAINALVPTFESGREWLEWGKQIETKRAVRAGGVVWFAWVLVNAILGARATLGIIGTLLLLLPSPCLNNTRTLLNRSLLIRRLAAFAFLFIFGSPDAAAPTTDTDTDEKDRLPAQGLNLRQWIHAKWTASKRPSFAFRAPARPPLARLTSASLIGSALDVTPPPSPTASTALRPSPPLYFRFELHENQRWWVGLDWTSALLPQERAAWCDLYLNPTSPPQGFALPGKSTVFLPERGGRVRRTARWRWVDEEWVVVRQGNPVSAAAAAAAATAEPVRTGSISAVPAASADEPKKGIAEQAFVKGLERLKARGAGTVGLPGIGIVKPRPASGDYTPAPSDTASRRSAEEKRRSVVSAAADAAGGVGAGVGGGVTDAPAAAAAAVVPSADLDAGTDADGWSYGDNKWEGMGPKGGMGKYTRRRRWQRRAICMEEIEFIPGDHAVEEGKVDKGKTGAQLDTGTGTSTGKDRFVVGASASPTRHRKNSKPRSGSLSLTHHSHSHQHGPEGYTVAPATAAPASSEVTVTPTTATEVLQASSVGLLRTRQESGEEGRDVRLRLRHAMGSMGA